MLIKYVIILLINVLFLFNSSVKAEIPNYIIGNNQHKITSRIDSFFIKHPNEKKVFWVPEIEGKSRYAFSIQKGAYLNSKRYLDAADLYYLSEKNDQGLKLQPNNFKDIDISFFKGNFNANYRQRFLLDVSTGIFFEEKENSFGIVLDKDFITSKNSMANLSIKQAVDEFTVFNAKFVKLFDTEEAEFYGNLNHEFKSDILNVGVGYTWFEIAKLFDFTIDVHGQNKEIERNYFASFGDTNVKFQIGLNQIKNNSNMNMFFNLRVENNLEKKNFKTNLMITSKENIFGLRNLSLKNFRKKSLDKIWSKHINYN
jgi:hypothetical protein